MKCLTILSVLFLLFGSLNAQGNYSDYKAVKSGDGGGSSTKFSIGFEVAFATPSLFKNVNFQNESKK